MINKFGIDEGFEEFSYLSTSGNGRRYRQVVRIMYEELKRKEFLYSSEIVDRMRVLGEEYDERTCNEDLKNLNRWGTVISYKNNYSKIKTLEEINRKRWRYQLSDRGRAIEEFIGERLKTVNILSTTLDPYLLIRLKKQLKEVYDESDEGQLYSKWKGIFDAFEVLNRNYRGYLSELSSFEYEKQMEEEKFLKKKKKLNEYLNDFIKILIDEGGEISEIIKKYEENGRIYEILTVVAKKDYEIRDLSGDADYEKIKETYQDQYIKLRKWFISEGESRTSENEMNALIDSTMNILQKITRMARQFIEKRTLSYSRKDSYLKISKMISEARGIKEVKEISSLIFGRFSINHMKGDYPLHSEIKSVYDSEEFTIFFRPLKERRERKVEKGVRNKKKIKEKNYIELRKRRKDENYAIKKYIQGGLITFSALPLISEEVQLTLINLVRAGLTKVQREVVVENGKEYYEYGRTRYNSFKIQLLRPINKRERAILRSNIGELEMPNFIIRFIEGED